MQLVLWNGFQKKLQVFNGTEEESWKLVESHLEEGSDVIYFFAWIDTITLRAY